ncbi:MAG: hypothetical protein ABSB34_12750 [Candidatus Limnocylindrales bacterium]|jgi:hypothetical protein
MSPKKLPILLLAAVFMVALAPAPALAVGGGGPTLASSPKWTLSYYSGDNGPYTMPAHPHNDSIATFAFDLAPNQALLTSADREYLGRGNLLGDTVRATISITAPKGTTFVGYDTGCSTPPTVRFYFGTKLILGAETSFQSGLYEDQLWWSNPVSISLADVFAAGRHGSRLSVSFTPAKWSNLVGAFGNNLVGTYSADFSKAASNVNTVGFSFGSGCTFAFGDGSNPAGALFNLLEFSIQPQSWWPW